MKALQSKFILWNPKTKFLDSFRYLIFRIYLQMKRFLIPIIIISLLATMFAQLLFEANADGASSDEQIHILSGYTTLTQGHVLFDPEHPFLAKALAAIPLLLIHPTVPYQASHLSPYQAQTVYNTYREANQWGYEMLFTSDNNPNQLLFLTRSVIAALTVLLAFVIYLWTKSLWGTASALAALALTAFEPSILAHGHLANDDTVAALFFIASLAAFHSFLKKPTYRWILICGFVLGLGLITKYSLLLLGPIFILLLIGWLLLQQSALPLARNVKVAHLFHLSYLSSLFARTNWRRYTFGLLAIFIIAWSVIWVSYGSLIILNPAQNPTTITNAPQVPPIIATITPYVIPVMYAKGAALLFDPNSHGRDGYLLGACYKGGRLDYFSVITFFKTPLPTIGLFIFACYLWWKNRRNNHFIPIIIFTSLLFYLGISSLSNINIGYRHMLPVGALIIITAAYPFSRIDWRRIIVSSQQQILKLTANTRFNAHTVQLISSKSIDDTRLLDHNRSWLPVFPSLLVVLALLASISSSLVAFPNHLPYYNILAGEPYNRPFISADSNIDWGQGTKALYHFMQQNNIDHLVLDNFIGTAEAESQNYPISPADPSNHTYQGYLALSRSTIIDHYCANNNDWGWVVDQQQPIAIVGGTINVYKLE